MKYCVDELGDHIGARAFAISTMAAGWENNICIVWNEQRPWATAAICLKMLVQDKSDFLGLWQCERSFY